MLVTMLYAGSHRLSGALRANELLGLKVLQHILRVAAVNHTTEIRALALMALVVCKLEQREFAKFVEVRVLRVGQSWVLVELLKLCALCSLLLNAFLDLQRLIEEALQSGTVFAVDGFLAAWAIHKVKRDSRGHPLLLEQIFNAVEMEDMSTAYLDGRLST